MLFMQTRFPKPCNMHTYRQTVSSEQAQREDVLQNQQDKRMINIKKTTAGY